MAKLEKVGRVQIEKAMVGSFDLQIAHVEIDTATGNLAKRIDDMLQFDFECFHKGNSGQREDLE